MKEENDLEQGRQIATTSLKPVKENKKKKRSTKKSRDPSTLTPEYIEEQRRQRNVKKENRKQELLSQGIDPETVNTPLELRFKTRELLELPNNAHTDDSFKIKIMSYNILAQALIRRKLFPTSGNALKWSTRSQVLLSEFKHCDADILCLQELDFIQYNSYWRKELRKLGYEMKYYRADTKNHGLAIAYKYDKFICKHQSFIYYDKESCELPRRTSTQNVGFLACLEFTPNILSKYSNISRNGIIIGTTHLFWHPFGTFERTRQTYLILKKFKEFRHTMNTLKNNGDDWYGFFAGDFNSQPFDAPYSSITAKPAKYSERARTVLGCSLSYQYSKNRGVDNEVHSGNKDEKEEELGEEEGGNIEKFGKNQPSDPVPESFEPTPEQLYFVDVMEKLHNELDMRAISLYSVGYKLVDPDNAGLDNDRDEPMFSNWAHAWRGLLDYIFVISSWDSENESYSDRIDTVKEVEQNNGVRLTKLLKLPLPDDMGPEPSGQPRLGQYPSDHLCLMAEVALC